MTVLVRMVGIGCRKKIADLQGLDFCIVFVLSYFHYIKRLGFSLNVINLVKSLLQRTFTFEVEINYF